MFSILVFDILIPIPKRVSSIFLWSDSLSVLITLNFLHLNNEFVMNQTDALSSTKARNNQIVSPILDLLCISAQSSDICIQRVCCVFSVVS